VTQTRLVPSAVVTMSFALEVQVGREPGPPGASAEGWDEREVRKCPD
jgi:hypothetical protein